MTRDELFDKVFLELNKTPDKFLLVDDWITKEFKIDNFQWTKSIVDELENRGWAAISNSKWSVLRITYDGQQILEKYKSYSFFLESERKAKSKNKKAQTIWTRTPTIISAVSTLAAIIFGTLSYLDRQELKEKEQIIIQQQIVTDSLRKCIERQQKIQTPH